MTKEQGQIKFSAEELIEARIFNNSRWTGNTIFRTTDCPDCKFHLVPQNNLETCEWGVTWKRLVPREKGERACVMLSGSQSSPREERILQLKEINLPKKKVT